jgi:cytidine deaminase
MPSDSDRTDWDELRSAAVVAASQGYAPYSGLQVGAAARTDLGTIVTGCNVENASYGLTLCAECGLVSALRVSGASRLVAICVVASDGSSLTPCGRCRQLLAEHAATDAFIDADPAPVLVSTLLPGAFTADDIAAHRRGETTT